MDIFFYPVIILSLENDEEKAFMMDLYKAHYLLMKNTAMKIVDDIQAAEDLVHDSVTKLINKVDVLMRLEERRLLSYVITTVKNTSKNYYNKHIGTKRVAVIGLDDDLVEQMVDEITPEDAFDVKEGYRELGEAIANLEETDRDLLYLKYNLEKNDAEIAAILGIQKNSVRQYLTRARRNARKLITREGDVR